MQIKTFFGCLSLFISSITFAQNADDVQHILDGINHFRMQHFLMPLKLNPSMNAIAQSHSLDMASHRIPTGHIGYEQRFAKIHKQIPHTYQTAENVASGYKDIDTVINGWIHSPGHRANILGPYNITGIAIAYDANHHPYYTQIFAKQDASIRPIAAQHHGRFIRRAHWSIG
jgi:uncharacterized protein YkwD